MNVFKLQKTHSSDANVNTRHVASNVKNAVWDLCRRNGDLELQKVAMSVKVIKEFYVFSSYSGNVAKGPWLVIWQSHIQVFNPATHWICCWFL